MELIKREIRPKVAKTHAYKFEAGLTVEQAEELAEIVGGRFEYDSHPGQEGKLYYWSMIVSGPSGTYHARVGDWIVAVKGGYTVLLKEQFEQDWEEVPVWKKFGWAEV